ncbi:hypothetical protein [Anaerophaga thermohalophila]|uniref:hypothetical protein n=1 Tax=Anaerophaga thermohalophila TaxID=177400 RepID=UPI0021004BA2|nr:hypothetical protein [Anaerophaga thermohalophila]
MNQTINTMQNIQIEDKKNSLILTINKKGLDKDYLIRLVKRLQTEDLIYKSGINEDILDIAEDVNNDWWNKNKEDFLK